MKPLFQPLRIRNLELRNRMAVSPMCQYSAEDGFANDWHLVHLGARAVGGAGAVIAEATAVSPEGRISINDVGLWKDEHIVPWKRVTDFIRSQGSVAGVQLAHAGRKASHSAPWKGDRLLGPEDGGWQVVAPSALKFSENDGMPIALDLAGVEKVKADFIMGAERAVEAGFGIIEIHAAHGYLMHEFLSPLSNRRTDQYGGSFENRVRLLCETADGIRRTIPAGTALFVRISCTDWAEGGWNPEESVKLALVLKGLGVDLIDCSSGGLVPGVKIPVGPGYQVQFAEKLKHEAEILTSAVGMITSAVQANEIIEKGQADLVLMGRELLRKPYLSLHAALELGVDIPWPNQYLRAKP